MSTEDDGRAQDALLDAVRPHVHDGDTAYDGVCVECDPTQTESILSPADQVQQRGSDAIKSAGWGATVRDLHRVGHLSPHDPTARCGECGHAPHRKPCLNLESDNECNCPGAPDPSSLLVSLDPSGGQG